MEKTQLYSWTPNELAQHYLWNSYLFYNQKKTYLTNNEYDLLCHLLFANFKHCDYEHKHLIKPELLFKFTGNYIENYPEAVAVEAERAFLQYS